MYFTTAPLLEDYATEVEKGLKSRLRKERHMKKTKLRFYWNILLYEEIIDLGTDPIKMMLLNV